jgi:hypothetical protein
MSYSPSVSKLLARAESSASSDRRVSLCRSSETIGAETQMRSRLSVARPSQGGFLLLVRLRKRPHLDRLVAGPGALRRGVGRPKMEDRRVHVRAAFVQHGGWAWRGWWVTAREHKSCAPQWGGRHKHIGGEFDPGSGLTLAACLMHASRTYSLRRATWRTGEEHVGNLPSGGG